MNGFLVFSRSHTDDVPLALFGTLSEAKSYAAAVKKEDIIRIALALFLIDVTQVEGVSVIEFSGQDAPRIVYVCDVSDAA